MSIVTPRNRDPETIVLLDSISQVDRELILIVPTVGIPGLVCSGCSPTAGPPQPAAMLLRYVNTRLRRRIRRVPLCRGCWSSRVAVILGEGAVEVRAYAMVVQATS